MITEREPMALGSSDDTPQNRTTLGLAFLVIGLLLLMWAWGSWIYRTSKAIPPIAVKGAADSTDESTRFLGVAPGMILGGVLLMVVFLAASFVLVRASRRYRRSLTRRPTVATDASDVWSMHKVRDSSDDGD
jgi:uncharacterized membrane protein YidH (DUF202 family)